MQHIRGDRPWCAAPGTTSRRLGELSAEAGRILVGRSALAPRRGDRGFTDVAWTDNPLLRRLVQLYLAGGRTAEQLLTDADLAPRDRTRAGFFLDNLVEAIAPSNVPLVNPASAKAAIDRSPAGAVQRHRCQPRAAPAAVVRFDVPGAGGSPTPKVPYNVPLLAGFVARLLDRLGYRRFDVLGLSWGGLAQQLAFQYPRRCRGLVLVSTGTGMLMVPASPRVLGTMLTPKRHRDPAYASSVASVLYGGRMRHGPGEASGGAERAAEPGEHGRLLLPAPRRGGLDKSARPAARPAADLDPHRKRRPAHPRGQRQDHASPAAPRLAHVFDDGHLGLVTSAHDLGPLASDFLASENAARDASHG